jgi:hypothetical protein|nr:MAG TPA: hypothetical protein [Caudoviricetes sp.]
MKRLIDIDNNDYKENPNNIDLSEYILVNIINNEESIILQKLYMKNSEGSPLMYFRIINPEEDYKVVPFLEVSIYEGNILGIPIKEIKRSNDFITLEDPLLVDLMKTAYLPKVLSNKENRTINSRPDEPIYGGNRYEEIQNRRLPEISIDDFSSNNFSKKDDMYPTAHLMFGESRTYDFLNIKNKFNLSDNELDKKSGWGRTTVKLRGYASIHVPSTMDELRYSLDFLNRQPYRLTSFVRDDDKSYVLYFPSIKNYSTTQSINIKNDTPNRYKDQEWIEYPPTPRYPYLNERFFSPNVLAVNIGTFAFMELMRLYNNIFSFNLLDEDKYIQLFKGSISQNNIFEKDEKVYNIYVDTYISVRITSDTFNIYNTQINLNMGLPTHVPFRNHFSRWGFFNIRRAYPCNNDKEIFRKERIG